MSVDVNANYDLLFYCQKGPVLELQHMSIHTVLCMCSYHHHDSFAQDNKQKINNLVLIFGANLVHSQCLFVSSRKRPSFRYNSSGRLNYFHKRRASVTYGFFRVPRVSTDEVFHFMFN